MTILPWEPTNRPPRMEAAQESSRNGKGGVGVPDQGGGFSELTQTLSTKLSSLNLQIPGLSAVAMRGDEKVCPSAQCCGLISCILNSELVL